MRKLSAPRVRAPGLTAIVGDASDSFCFSRLRMVNPECLHRAGYWTDRLLLGQREAASFRKVRWPPFGH